AYCPYRSPATGITQAAGVLPDPPNLPRQRHSLRSPQLLEPVARSFSPRAPAPLSQDSETLPETIRVFAPPALHDRSAVSKKTFHPTRPADSSHPAPPRVKRKPRDTPAHQPTRAAPVGVGAIHVRTVAARRLRRRSRYCRNQSQNLVVRKLPVRFLLRRPWCASASIQRSRS